MNILGYRKAGEQPMLDVKKCVRFTVSKGGYLKTYMKGSRLGRLKNIALPEGIARIGENAMCYFSCRELVMPSTLKVIDKCAFSDASIGDIDFNGCKLEIIDNRAFKGCVARAELPDTVEYIGDECDLELVKERRLKLPKSLKCISSTAIVLDGVDEVIIQESLVTKNSNLLNWLYYSSAFKDWIVLRVYRDGKELYRLVHDECRPVDHSDYNYASPEGMNYERYDNYFKCCSSMLIKVNMAAYRLIWPIDLPEDMAANYRAYVRSNFLTLISGKEEDIEHIKLLNEAGLITAFRLKQLLENATQKKNIEVTAFLIETINKTKGSKAKSLKL
jgi:hypothetical protein